MKKTKKTNKKYEIKRNNYIGLLLFALILVSALYIIKSKNEVFKELDPTIKEIINDEEKTTEINSLTPEIKELTNYLNLGDINTFKIYQSSYVYNEKINSANINNESMLYIAYKYIEKTTDFSKYTKIITCDEAKKVNLEKNIYQCGGNKYTNSYYTVNTYITKDLLKKTIQSIFNRNINKYTNFYTSENNLCYFIDNNYLCISHKTSKKDSSSEVEFIKAYKTHNRISIIQKYRYINEGIYYKGFNSNEVGEEYYISTFNKINGKYYWESTEVYNKN